MQEYGNEFADIRFNLPNALENANGLWIVRAGRNEAKPHYAIGPKVIDCYGFHFVLEGMVRLEYDGKSDLLRKNDVFCLLPHVSYSYRKVPSSEPLRMAWLTLDGGMAGELANGIGIRRDRPFRTGLLDRSAKSVIMNILELTRGGASMSELLQRQSLLLRLFAGFAEEQGVEHAKESSEWLSEAIDYFDLHYTEPLTIGDAARKAGVHRSHFCTSFTRRVGMSPQVYIQRLRMEKASRLLRDTALSVGEIALSVGFQDVYGFSRAFKKWSGATPSGFRAAKE